MKMTGEDGLKSKDCLLVGEGTRFWVVGPNSEGKYVVIDGKYGPY